MATYVNMPFGLNAMPDGVVTRFGDPGGQVTKSLLTTPERFFVLPTDMEIVGISVSSRTFPSLILPIPPNPPVVVTYTVRKNGADTALILSISLSSNSTPLRGTASGSVLFSSGDRLSLKYQNSAAWNVGGAPQAVAGSVIGRF